MISCDIYSSLLFWLFWILVCCGRTLLKIERIIGAIFYGAYSLKYTRNPILNAYINISALGKAFKSNANHKLSTALGKTYKPNSSLLVFFSIKIDMELNIPAIQYRNLWSGRPD